MQYFVKRGEQKYGPYNLSDLQKYVQSGNIALDDVTQSEGMGDWVPVSQVLGNIPATAVTSGGAAAAPAGGLGEWFQLPGLGSKALIKAWPMNWP